jgi:hypothetical protein
VERDDAEERDGLSLAFTDSTLAHPIPSLSPQWGGEHVM